MSAFFGPEPVRLQFKQFSWLHAASLGGLAVGSAATVALRKYFRNNPRLRRWTPIALGCPVWALEIVYHAWNYVHDFNFVVNLVPLELCSIALWMTVAICFTRSQAIFEIYYFLSVGALAALAFPDFGAYGPDHIRYWMYFACHGFIVWLTVWMLAVEGQRLRPGTFRRLLMVIAPLIGLIRFVNKKFNTNYMYLAGPTGSSSPLDFLGTGLGYFIKLILLVLAAFTLLYLIAPKARA
ncbi:MAG: TIGR02206 family membrane protein [Propionibacteriaceae bacterium]|jgi:hypothetical integral membrane protein (TIGR02206 family)|nr:TIGR02206 family membrane protein [Propionibacteriaceae bacterium]